MDMETMYSLLLIMVHHILSVKTRETIIFLNQPEDVYVDINGTAQFVCLYEGSQAFPTWKINGLDYSYPVVPSKHQIDSTGSYLTVHNVDLSLEGNTYQCIINSCFSDIGHLYVLYNYSRESKSPFMIALAETLPQTTEKSQLVHFSKMISANSVNASQPKEVFIPIVLSSTIPLLCVITLATVIGFGTYIKFRYSSKRLKNKVESPETDLSRNEAYERANIVISMKRNDAYESVLKSKL